MVESLYRCPVCGSMETPRLVVRGSGMRDSGVSTSVGLVIVNGRAATQNGGPHRIREEFTGS